MLVLLIESILSSLEADTPENVIAPELVGMIHSQHHKSARSSCTLPASVFHMEHFHTPNTPCTA